jgi:hypothetical protein
MHPSQPLFPALFLLLFAATGDFQYAPKQGTEITRIYNSVMELELVDSSVEVLVDGESRDGPQPELEISVRQESRVEVLDTFEKVEDGQILVLTRAFVILGHGEHVQVSVDGQERNPPDSEDESDLEGRTVRFTFDEDSESWQPAWADDEEGDEELLSDLRATSGFAFLLPAGDDCDVGDEWELSDDEGVEALALLLYPLGELSLFSDGEDPEEERESSALFRDNLAVEEFLLALKSMQDGRAVIQIKVEGSTAFERTPELPEEMQAMGMEVVEGFDLELLLEGELVWDLALHHMVSLEYTAEVELVNTSVQSGSGGGPEMEITQSQVFEGEISYEVTLR